MSPQEIINESRLYVLMPDHTVVRGQWWANGPEPHTVWAVLPDQTVVLVDQDQDGRAVRLRAA